MKKFLFPASLFLFIGVTLWGALQAKGASNDTALTVASKTQEGPYTLVILDSNDGISSFSINIKGENPYGDELNCSKTFKTENVSFRGAPFPLSAFVIDCKGNRVEFEIPDPAGGTINASVTATISSEGKTSAPNQFEAETGVTAGGAASAKTRTDAPKIEFPIPELGNCTDEAGCRAYCDRRENRDVCFTFAKWHGLIPPEEIAKIEKFKSLGTGPGGCDSPGSCEAYCNDVTNIDACVTFAEKHGLMSGNELARAKKIREATGQGVKLPGGCRNRTACEAYCKNPRHMDECLAFAEESGFMGREELERAKRILPLMREGKTPGGCTSEEECRAYCERGDEHRLNECFAFAEQNGLMSRDELDRFRKFKDIGGPGGCKSKEQCESYCQANQEKCFEWAKQNEDLIPEKDRERIREGSRQIVEVLKKAPPEVKECLRETIGEEGIAKLEAGGFPDPSIGGKMRGCFEKSFGRMMRDIPPQVKECLATKGIDLESLRGAPPADLEAQMRACFEESGSFPGGPDSQGEHSGLPPEVLECLKANGADVTRLRDGSLPPEAQQCFAKFGGGFPGAPREFPGGPGEPPRGGFEGPGGCRTAEECRAYCEKNPDACGYRNSGGARPLPPEGLREDSFLGERRKEGFTPERAFPPEEVPRDAIPFPASQEQYRTPEYQNQYQQPQYQYQNQYQQQYQEQYRQQCEQAGGHWNGTSCERPQSQRFNPPSLLGFFAQVFLGLTQ